MGKRHLSKKTVASFLCGCLLILSCSGLCQAKHPPLQKKDVSLQLPARPALALKYKPQKQAEDFLSYDTKTISEDPFFQTAAFIGDSITHGLTSLEAFDPLPIMADLGLTLTKAKNRLPDWQVGQIETLFILLGINDITYNSMSTDTYLSLYEELLTALEKRFPEALLVVQTILPVTTSYQHTKINNQLIDEYNQALRDFCNKRGTVLAEICIPFCQEDGSLNPQMSPDGLHLYYQYYGAWLALLEYTAEFS